VFFEFLLPWWSYLLSYCRRRYVAQPPPAWEAPLLATAPHGSWGLWEGPEGVVRLRHGDRRYPLVASLSVGLGQGSSSSSSSSGQISSEFSGGFASGGKLLPPSPLPTLYAVRTSAEAAVHGGMAGLHRAPPSAVDAADSAGGGGGGIGGGDGEHGPDAATIGRAPLVRVGSGSSVSFTVDVSAVGCGCTAAL